MQRARHPPGQGLLRLRASVRRRADQADGVAPMARAMAVQMSEAELRVCLLACLDDGGKVMMAAGWCVCVHSMSARHACARQDHGQGGLCPCAALWCLGAGSRPRAVSVWWQSWTNRV
jgi:hypothetical protein